MKKSILDRGLLVIDFLLIRISSESINLCFKMDVDFNISCLK